MSVKNAYLQFLNTEYGADTYTQFKEILYSSHDTLITEIIKQVLPILSISKQGEILNICDIGSGDGKRTLEIARSVGAKYNTNYQIDFVEQSSVFCKRLRNDIHKIYNEKFETVDLSRHSYDLILLIHSIFCFDPNTALDKILDLRNQGGEILIVSNAPQSFLGGLKLLIDDNFNDKRYEVDDLLKDLGNRNIYPYTIEFETKWSLDTNHKDSSILTILNWLSLGKYQSFDRNKKEKIVSYIDENTKSFVGGRIEFLENEIVILF